MNITSVREIPEHYQFVSDSQDVEAVKEHLPPNAWDFGRQFDSFFVWQRDGEYVSVYGLFGIVPYLDASIYKVL